MFCHRFAGAEVPLSTEIGAYYFAERDKSPIFVYKVFRTWKEELTKVRRNDGDFRMIQGYLSNNVLGIALDSYYPLCNRGKVSNLFDDNGPNNP